MSECFVSRRSIRLPDILVFDTSLPICKAPMVFVPLDRDLMAHIPERIGPSALIFRQRLIDVKGVGRELTLFSNGFMVQVEDKNTSIEELILNAFKTAYQFQQIVVSGTH